MIRPLLPGSVPAVLIGDGAMALVAEKTSELSASRALVLATPGRTRVAQQVATLLGASSAGLLAIAEEHVPVAVAEQGRAETTARKADALIAVGGGSTVGLAKVIALTHGLPIIVLPTTLSGSEMTPIWGMTEQGVKRTGRDERARARTVLYDPRLSLGLPPAVAVPSAFNAIAHAAEALYAPEANTNVRNIAEGGVRLLVSALPGLAAHSQEVGPREQALQGACLAGHCLSTTSMGLHHKLCHVLGGRFGLPHAATHAVLLPHVLRFNLEAVPEARVRLARALGAADPAQALAELARATGVSPNLESLGLASHMLDEAARLATNAPYSNPRPVTQQDVRAILESAHRGL